MDRVGIGRVTHAGMSHRRPARRAAVLKFWRIRPCLCNMGGGRGRGEDGREGGGSRFGNDWRNRWGYRPVRVPRS